MIPLPEGTKLTSKQIDDLIDLMERELDVREKEVELKRYELSQRDREISIREVREKRLAENESGAG